MTGQAVHLTSKYGKWAERLDQSFARYGAATKIAAHRGWADDEANAQADRAWADYQTARNIAAHLAEHGFADYWQNEEAVQDNRRFDGRDVS